MTCTVCGTQSDDHANWFLVRENRWLDHLKVWSWHPTLADQAEIYSICGEEHLKILVLHWLTKANLDLQRANVPPNGALAEPVVGVEPVAAGRLLGELAVHRNSHSQHWTGSTEAMECILTAITGREVKARAADYSLASFHMEPTEELAYACGAGCV